MGFAEKDLLSSDIWLDSWALHSDIKMEMHASCEYLQLVGWCSLQMDCEQSLSIWCLEDHLVVLWESSLLEVSALLISTDVWLLIMINKWLRGARHLERQSINGWRCLGGLFWFSWWGLCQRGFHYGGWASFSATLMLIDRSRTLSGGESGWGGTSVKR